MTVQRKKRASSWPQKKITAMFAYSNEFTIDKYLREYLGTADGGHGVALVEFNGAIDLCERYVLCVQQILDRSDVLLSGQHASGRRRVQDNFTRHGDRFKVQFGLTPFLSTERRVSRERRDTAFFIPNHNPPSIFAPSAPSSHEWYVSYIKNLSSKFSSH